VTLICRAIGQLTASTWKALPGNMVSPSREGAESRCGPDEFGEAVPLLPLVGAADVFDGVSEKCGHPAHVCEIPGVRELR
jgi:hypothetical protein